MRFHCYDNLGLRCGHSRLGYEMQQALAAARGLGANMCLLFNDVRREGRGGRRRGLETSVGIGHVTSRQQDEDGDHEAAHREAGEKSLPPNHQLPAILERSTLSGCQVAKKWVEASRRPRLIVSVLNVLQQLSTFQFRRLG